MNKHELLQIINERWLEDAESTVEDIVKQMLFEAHEQIELLKVELAVLKAGKDQ